MAAVKCLFHVLDNKLIAESGADAGTYPILDNHAKILISATEYNIKPYDFAYCSIDTKQQLRVTVNT